MVFSKIANNINKVYAKDVKRTKMITKKDDIHEWKTKMGQKLKDGPSFLRFLGASSFFHDVARYFCLFFDFYRRWIAKNLPRPHPELAKTLPGTCPPVRYLPAHA